MHSWSRWCNVDGLAARGASPITSMPLRAGVGDERRGDQVLHRVARAQSCISSRAGPAIGAAQRARCDAPDQLAQAWQLDWSAAVPSPARRGEPVRRRPRLRPRHRAGSGAEAQGNLRAARRGIQRRRGAGTGRWRSSARLPGARCSRRTTRRRAGVEALARDFVARGADVLVAGARSTARIALPTTARRIRRSSRC